MIAVAVVTSTTAGCEPPFALSFLTLALDPPHEVDSSRTPDRIAINETGCKNLGDGIS
jgi:hypothetical protein